MTDIQEWRDAAHKLIEEAEAFHLIIIRDEDQAVGMFPIRDASDRDLILEHLDFYREAYPREHEPAPEHQVS